MPEPDVSSRPAPRVVAVVVTRNRARLLQRLLDRLTRVPELDHVVVVDNASTDETARVLAGWSEPDGPVSVVALGENRGGAGGFHAGIARALETGAELLWLMDDDGLPAPDCLATLLPRAGELDFFGPAVVAEQDPGRLCFPIRLPGTTRVVHAMPAVREAAPDGVLPDVVIPFNGVLLTRALVEQIGLPRSEFFLWGDDVEYLWRARAAGARVATVTDARFYHPATDELGTPMLRGRTTYNHSPSDLKHYCMARNNVVNLRDYRGWPHVLAFVLKTTWFYGRRRDRARLRLSARAVAAGLRGDFSGHRELLR